MAKNCQRIFINPQEIGRVLKDIHGHRMDQVDGLNQTVVGVGNEFKNDTNIPAFGIIDTRVMDVGRQFRFHI